MPTISVCLQGPAQVWTAPKQFERESTKFWLRPGDEMRFKVAMCRHLPVLVFGKARQLVPGQLLSSVMAGHSLHCLCWLSGGVHCLLNHAACMQS